MFGFLKKKSPKNEAAKPLDVEQAPEPVAEDEAGLAEPVPEQLDERAGQTGVAEPDIASAQVSRPEPPVGDESAPVEVDRSVAAEGVEQPVPAGAALEAAEPARSSWSERLRAGLSRTRQQIGGGLADFFGLRKIDDEFMEELETTLLMADCGVEATQYLMDELRRRWIRDRIQTAEEMQQALMGVLKDVLRPLEAPLDVSGHSPFIIMIAGVNGSGKTTSIGKLAKYFQAQGKSVLLAAGDTFRAAAREQLETWGERNNVTVIAQEGGDSAAVIFDAVNAARSRGIDVVLADTAGRLPTQLHLMDEIAKVKRVIGKADASAPHEVLLVLDANIGQNALTQVKAFDASIGVTGLVLTKLDGTAKGGIVAAIARQYPRPLRYIGVGEGIDDLQPFRVDEFVEALFARSPEKPAA